MKEFLSEPDVDTEFSEPEAERETVKMTVLHPVSAEEIEKMTPGELITLASTCETVMRERDIEPLFDGLTQIPEQTPQCLPAQKIIEIAALCNRALEKLGVDLRDNEDFSYMSHWRIA